MTPKEVTPTNLDVKTAKNRIYDVLASLSDSQRREVILHFLNDVSVFSDQDLINLNLL